MTPPRPLTNFQTKRILDSVVQDSLVSLVVEMHNHFVIFKVISLISLYRVTIGGKGSSSAGPGDEEAGEKGEGTQNSCARTQHEPRLCGCPH